MYILPFAESNTENVSLCWGPEGTPNVLLRFSKLGQSRSLLLIFLQRSNALLLYLLLLLLLVDFTRVKSVIWLLSLTDIRLPFLYRLERGSSSSFKRSCLFSWCNESISNIVSSSLRRWICTDTLQNVSRISWCGWNITFFRINFHEFLRLCVLAFRPWTLLCPCSITLLLLHLMKHVFILTYLLFKNHLIVLNRIQLVFHMPNLDFFSFFRCFRSLGGRDTWSICRSTSSGRLLENLCCLRTGKGVVSWGIARVISWESGGLSLFSAQLLRKTHRWRHHSSRSGHSLSNRSTFSIFNYGRDNIV